MPFQTGTSLFDVVFIIDSVMSSLVAPFRLTVETAVSMMSGDGKDNLTENQFTALFGLDRRNDMSRDVWTFYNKRF